MHMVPTVDEAKTEKSDLCRNKKLACKSSAIHKIKKDRTHFLCDGALKSSRSTEYYYTLILQSWRLYIYENIRLYKNLHSYIVIIINMQIYFWIIMNLYHIYKVNLSIY